MARNPSVRPVVVCVDCGCDVVPKQRGPLPTRCDDCRVEFHRLAGKQQAEREKAKHGRSNWRKPLASLTINCADCDVEIPRTRKRGNGPGICARCATERRKDSHYRRRFGISRVEYLAMVEQQGGRCAICAATPPPVTKQRGATTFQITGLCVDHDHTTGRVRGLLCNACNTLLGLANDSPDQLRAAIAYLTT